MPDAIAMIEPAKVKQGCTSEAVIKQSEALVIDITLLSAAKKGCE